MRPESATMEVLDAAKVLFSLQYGGNISDTEQPSISSKACNERYTSTERSEADVAAAEMILKCFNHPFASSTPKSAPPESSTRIKTMKGTQNSVTREPTENCHKTVRGEKIRQFTIKSGIDSKGSRNENVDGDQIRNELFNALQIWLNEETKKLCDTIKQPELTIQQVDAMEESMMQLDGLVQHLKGHVRSISARYRIPASPSNGETVADRAAITETQETVQHNAIDGNSIAMSPNPDQKSTVHYPTEDSSVSTKASSSQWNKKRRNQSNRNMKEKMIPIGYGNAKVPAKVMREIVGKPHTVVTRKLLTAVFPRRVLASHSLTGRPSPAFPNKPAKKKLNEVMVNDIIMEVMKKCNTQESHVRTSITTKCADEAKMYRNRKKKNCLSKKENVQPADFESEAENSDYSMYADSD